MTLVKGQSPLFKLCNFKILVQLSKLATPLVILSFRSVTLKVKVISGLILLVK